ncbi:MAG: tyrosine-type recombinase/integrase [Caldilineaceae bacterium]|nr:tyrosine-type recombinase/integrase [Caldilineaceae bacterium]
MPTNRGTPSFTDALQIFLLDAKSRRLSVHTIEWYEQRLGWVQIWLEEQGVEDVPSITANHIRQYLAEMDERGWKDWTVHAAARAIKTFLNFCVAEGWIDVSPMLRVKMSKIDEDILPALEPDQVRKLLQLAKCERDRAIILCLLDTGCRASEFISWTGADVDTSLGVVKVRGKGRKERHVYLGSMALKSLLRYFIERGRPAPQEAVWISLKGGEPLTYNGLRLMLSKLGKRAGVENSNPHSFRRTFALWALRSGMNIYELQRLMSHADIQVLRRYLALVEHDLAAAHKRNGPVDNILGKK